MASIVVVGSINMDLVVQAPRFPEPGETLIGHGFFTAPGGKGANQAVAAARLGAHVAMAGRVGDDTFGEQVLRYLQAEGIDTQHISVDPGSPTAIGAITLLDSGRNGIVIVPGANWHVSPQDVDAVLASGSADAVLLQLEIPLPTVEYAIQAAREKGVRVMLNAAPATTLPTGLLSSVDYLLVNEIEATQMTGLNMANMWGAARSLREAGARTVIVTLGEKGALLLSESESFESPAFAVGSLDTTAAGDAFVGALAVAIAEGVALPDAVRWANVAGAICTTRLGAQPSLPTRQEVDDFLQAHQ